MLLHLQRQQPVVVIGAAESRHRAVPIVCQVPRGAGQALGVGLGVFTEDAVLQVEANGCQVVAESLVQQLQLLQVAGVQLGRTVDGGHRRWVRAWEVGTRSGVSARLLSVKTKYQAEIE